MNYVEKDITDQDYKQLMKLLFHFSDTVSFGLLVVN